MAALFNLSRTLLASFRVKRRQVLHVSFLHQNFCVTLGAALPLRPANVISKEMKPWTLHGPLYYRHFATNGLTLSKSSVDHAVNQKISASHILLIDENGANQGLKSREEALAIAQEKSLQLVEVQKPSNGHSVCRLYSSKTLIKDQIRKKKLESKSKTHASKIKELVVGSLIAPQDLEWKTNKVHSWLEERHQVKLCITHKHWQKVTEKDKLTIIQQVAEAVKDVGELDGKPKQAGPLLIKCIFRPVHQK